MKIELNNGIIIDDKTKPKPLTRKQLLNIIKDTMTKGIIVFFKRLYRRWFIKSQDISWARIQIGNILILRNGQKVKMIVRRNSRIYVYPVWYEDTDTKMLNGCKLRDVKKLWLE